DITTQAVVQKKSRVEEAIFIAKANGVLCGLQEAEAILEDGGLDFESGKMEGNILKKGDIIAKVRGNIEEILKRERTALNYLQVLSGIATATYKLVNRYPGKISSLRKTHPGLSYCEKRAVKVGGGFTHRISLDDGFLIKDNHLAAITREMFGDDPINEEKKVKAIREALKRAKQYWIENKLENCFIEVEVESLIQAISAAKFYRSERVPDMILLDNMKPEDVAVCVKAIRRAAGREILIESSGGVTPKNICDYIKTGVDIVSTSKLTLSAEPLDINMKIVGYKMG
ncbi:MAG: carboxylating nicotinate-nucleotide diphosphorylase, partial [Candidatus Bathyarchaeota archaeon]